MLSDDLTWEQLLCGFLKICMLRTFLCSLKCGISTMSLTFTDPCNDTDSLSRVYGPVWDLQTSLILDLPVFFCGVYKNSIASSYKWSIL